MSWCYRTGCWVVYILFYYYCFAVCPFPAEGCWGPVACWPWGRVAPRLWGSCPTMPNVWSPGVLCDSEWECSVCGSAPTSRAVDPATSVSTSAKGRPDPLPKYHPQSPYPAVDEPCLEGCPVPQLLDPTFSLTSAEALGTCCTSLAKNQSSVTRSSQLHPPSAVSASHCSRGKRCHLLLGGVAVEHPPSLQSPHDILGVCLQHSSLQD